MELLKRSYHWFFTGSKERYLSELLSLLTGMIVMALFHYPVEDHAIMTFIMIFIGFIILFRILDGLFRYFLGKRNRVVGFGSYLIAAVVIATVNTIINIYQN
jgi:hypothetical protein